MCNSPRNPTENLKWMSKELVDIGDAIDKTIEEIEAELEPSTELMREVISGAAETIKVGDACNR